MLVGWTAYDVDTSATLSRAAERAVVRLLKPKTGQAPPIDSDQEHADTLAPILAADTEILLHYDNLPRSDPLEARYMVSGGRVFAYNLPSYGPLEMPLLRIRPIDGGQEVPFLIRTVLYPGAEAHDDGSLEIVLPAPAIFKPELETRAVWIGARPTQAHLTYSPASGAFNLQIPITTADLHDPRGGTRPVSVVVDGVLSLRRYAPLSQRQFADIGGQPLAPDLTRLASLVAGRDYRDASEAERIRRAAGDITAAAKSSYDKIAAVNEYVGATVRYLRNPVHRKPAQILEERVGDCDDRSVLMVALLRAIGIPCRQVTGYLYDFSRFGLHAWVEVALPSKDGEFHWFICDPTAVNLIVTEDPDDRFVQTRSRLHLYPIQPVVAVNHRHLRHSTDILLKVGKAWDSDRLTALRVKDFVEGVTGGVNRELDDRAGALIRADLMIRRELPLSPGSRYVVAERTITEGRSRLMTSLEHQELLSIELMSTGPGSDLHGEPEQQIIDAMRSAYDQLSWLLFGGIPAHYCLDLIYSRDPRTDRLQRVTLSFGRYLVENYLDEITRRLRKEGLSTENETELLKSLHDASGGTNLYYLQELALRRVRGTRREVGR